MWHNDRSFEVRRQHTASVAQRKYRRAVLQRRLCREETLTNSVKEIHITSQRVVYGVIHNNQFNITLIPLQLTAFISVTSRGKPGLFFKCVTFAL